MRLRAQSYVAYYPNVTVISIRNILLIIVCLKTCNHCYPISNEACAFLGYVCILINWLIDWLTENVQIVNTDEKFLKTASRPHCGPDGWANDDDALTSPSVLRYPSPAHHQGIWEVLTYLPTRRVPSPQDRILSPKLYNGCLPLVQLPV